MSITYNGKSVLAIYRNGTAVEQALIAWNWTPRQLYFGGVRGAAYVPDAGEVYGPNGLASFGENISAMLDEKNGTPVFGPQLWATTVDYSIGTGASSEIDGIITISGTDTNNRGRRGLVISSLIVGSVYEVSFNVTAFSGSAVALSVQASAGLASPTGAPAVSNTGIYKFLYTAVATSRVFNFFTGVSGATATIENTSVREISGNHTIQASTSPRPLLGRAPVSVRNLFTDTETAVNAVNTTAVLKQVNIGDREIPGWTVNSESVGSVSTYVGKSYNIQTAIDVTLSVYVRPLVNRYIYISTSTAAQNNIGAKWRADTETGTVTQIYTGNNTARFCRLENLGAGLFKLTATWRPTSTLSLRVFGIFCSSVNETTGANTFIVPTSVPNGPFEVAGWQSEQAGATETEPVATPYQRVGAATDITESGVTSFPFIRMDLSDDALTTVLGSTKNTFRFTDELDNAAWTKNDCTITPLQVDRAGGNSAFLLANTSSTNPFLRSAFVSTLGTYTFSLYAKYTNAAWVHLYFSGAVCGSWFNIQTGAKGAGSGTNYISHSIESAENGYYRISVTLNITVSGTLYPSVRLVTADNASGATAGLTAYVQHPQYEPGSVATAYEYGGFKGTALVAGRNGTAVESVTLPDGNFTLGPIGVTSGTPGLLRAVGDIVGYNLINKTLTPKERKYLIEYYKDRGAKGLLVMNGPELLTNGTFETDVSGWQVAGCTVSKSGNAMRITDSDGATGYAFRSVSLEIGKAYLASVEVTLDAITGALTLYMGTTSGSAQMGLSSLANGPGTISFVFTATATTGWVAIRNVTAVAGEYWEVDNVSVKELRPEEEWV